MTTKLGILYELKNGEPTIVLDLNNDHKFFSGYEGGLLSVVTNNDDIYISYTINGDGAYKWYLVVDEY